ncbi:response regulator [Acetobacteraceae bacterium KSS8]|uniref:histidine kinase n=1 Tax=Endosaccharibacter trunci TaxID=2812733 RepID=A0ABT1W757_9PROT|nr:response regulator [Acetobacteraceae bacterium KSS8]
MNGSGANGRLLLVEDSDTQALMIRRVLERGGFSVERAASAEAALDSLNQAVPDLVVCDYHLPGMSGGELVRALRLNVRTRAIPVLMLTEASEPGLEREGLESGADAYVPKSSDQSLILLRIGALLRQGGAQPASDRTGAAAEFGREVGVFRRARVLLLHQSRDAAENLAALLGREGYEAEILDDPENGLAEAVAEARGAVDCVVVDLEAQRFDGIALCAWLNIFRLRADAEQSELAPVTSLRILGLGDGERAGGRLLVAQAYGAGVDDVVSGAVGAEAIGLRVRAMVRRKLLQDETARIETELRGRQAAIDRAREEAAAFAAKAALAEALAEANEQLREAQGKLVQTAKMASLGELVAGIAHEINNPLAFIVAHQGTVSRLLDQIAGNADASLPAEIGPKLAKARERVSAMSLGLKRIENLVLNLRKFSRLDESEHQTVDVPDAIDTVLTLLTHKLGTGITVERQFDAPRELSCQPALLNQVIMNIVGNAADALNAEPVRTAARVIRIATALEGENYTIAIADNGPGVPDTLRERVFEPFFTTKPVGSGTGLGLAIAYNVVRAHGGAIVLDTPDGGGARFTVSVPAGVARIAGAAS